MRLPFGLALSVVLALFAVGPVAASSADTNLMQSGTSAVYFSQMCEGDESLAATCSTTFLFVLSGKTHDKVGHVITRNQACVEASVETFDESVERISFHGKFGCQTLRKGVRVRIPASAPSLDRRHAASAPPSPVASRPGS